MYIEWLIIYILYIQGGPKWYCNRVIFKYLTVVFFIGKEGMRSGPASNQDQVALSVLIQPNHTINTINLDA